MLIQLSVALAVYAAAADTSAIYGMSHEIASPRDLVSATKTLESALQKFERDLSGKRGRGQARSSKPKEIVVVGSKVKDVVRSSRAPGGFKSVSGLDSETDVVEFRDGGPASLPQLKAAIGRFERAAGLRSPCVGSCRAAERRCLANCRRALSARKATGRCVCDHIRARCLVQAIKERKCSPKARRRH